LAADHSRRRGSAAGSSANSSPPCPTIRGFEHFPWSGGVRAMMPFASRYGAEVTFCGFIFRRIPNGPLGSLGTKNPLPHHPASFNVGSKPADQSVLLNQFTTRRTRLFFRPWDSGSAAWVVCFISKPDTISYFQRFCDRLL
jgi:hypothetical protein